MPTLMSSRCPNCGAQVNVRGDEVTCSYCGWVLVRRDGALHRGMDAEGDSGDAHARNGISAYREDKYRLAITELERALQMELREYERDDLYNIMGNAQDNLGEREAALRSYCTAREINPINYQAWGGQGIVNRKLGRYDEAERCYREALSLNPDYAELHASLGALYIYRDEAQRAIAALERAIQLDPNCAVAHANIAIAYAMTGRFDEADAALRRAVMRGYKQVEAVRQRIEGFRALSK